MGFGQIFTVITFIMIFAAMTTLVVTTQKGMAESARELKEQQTKQNKYQEQEIEIKSTSYSSTGTQDWTVTYAYEFDEGSYTNTTTKGDQVELNPSNTTGDYTSEIYDTGSISNYSTISWTTVEPGNSNITYQLRTDNTSQQLQARSFIGPDGTTGTYYNISGTSIGAYHNQSQYIQWRAYLKTNDTTPELRDLTIGIMRKSGEAFLQVENTGKDKLEPEQTDIYVDGIRLNRSEANRVFKLEVISDPQLWNPGEDLNITVFTNVTGPTTITIANEYASDQAVVS